MQERPKIEIAVEIKQIEVRADAAGRLWSRLRRSAGDER